MRLAVVIMLVVGLGARAEDEKKEKPKVTGTIEFKEKVKFVEGTKVSIQIQDVSIADKEATVMGEQVINNPKEFPIAFAIAYKAEDIRKGLRYSLSCRITDKDGKLLYINDTSIPVLTDKDERVKGVKVPVISVRR